MQLENVLGIDSKGFTKMPTPAEQYTHSMSIATLLMPTKDEMLLDIERQRDELALRLQTVDKVAHQGHLEAMHEQFRKKFEDLKTNWLCISRQYVVDLKYELQGVKCDLQMEKTEKQAVEITKSTLDSENERLLGVLWQERTRNEALQNAKLKLDSDNRRLLAELQQERSLKEALALEIVARLNVNSEKKQPAEAKSAVEDSTIVMRVPRHSHVPPSAQPSDSPTPVLAVRPSLVPQRVQPSATSASAQSTPTTTKFHLKALQARGPETRLCDSTRLHEYLSDAEFQEVFGMSAADFGKMPGWKQADAKKKHRLF